MGSTFTVALVLLMLATFCICGIPFGLIFGDARGVDVRTKGSGNIGTTNVAREVGVKAAVLTLVCDVLKGFVCTFFGARVLAALCLGGDLAPVMPGGGLAWSTACLFMAAVLGHVFSPYLRFHGGKGIAVGFGAALGFSAPVALGLLVVWALCTVPSKVVSLGSVAAAVALPFLTFFIYYPVDAAFELPFVVVACVVVWAHRENIAKMRSGTESSFAFKASDSPERAADDEAAAKRAVDEPGSEGPDAAARDEREALAETAAVDAAEGHATVAEVQEAAEEAAERDASSLPAPGEGVVFGDEEAVSEMIRERTDRER